MTNKPELTKREKKFLSTFVYYGWNIEVWNKRGKITGCWDGDKMFPVKIGPVALRLIERGYLEHIEPDRLISTIRATKKSQSLKCQNNRCRAGNIHDVMTGRDTGESCPYCEFGILPEKDHE
ncbi:hypothetical protein BKM35_22265 [Salmonella enterica]|nr:hypothetical protein [Salmonella enterica]